MLQASSLCSPERNLHRYGRFYRWVRVVTDEFEVFEPEIVDVFDRRIQFHPGQRSATAGKLLACLLKMVVVKMQITERMNEIAWRKIDDLRHHHREQRVRRDVERHAEKQIGATLIQLATQFASLFATGRIRLGGHVKLEEHVTWWECHVL